MICNWPISVGLFHNPVCLFVYFTDKNSCTCSLHFWASFHACYLLWGDQLASVYSRTSCIFQNFQNTSSKDNNYHITLQYSWFTPHNSWGSCTSWVIWCRGDYLCISFYVVLSFVALRSHLVCQPVQDWCLSMTTFIWRTNRDVQETTQCPFDWASLFCHFMAFWGEHTADEKQMSKLTKAVKSLKPSTNSHKVKRKRLQHYFDSNILFSFNTTFSQERHKSHHEPYPVCSYCLFVVSALLSSFNPSWQIGLLNRGNGASWGPCWTEFSTLNLNLNPYHLLFSFQEFHNSSPNNLALLFHTCVLCFMLSYSEIFPSIVSLKFVLK